jgi:V/A-type H+/Na+-transporting ATPase subunit E
MEAEQVVQKILGDAKAEAERITQEAREKEAAEQTKLNEQLDQYGKQTENLAKKAGEDEEAHILAAARMDIAKQLLAEKRKILDEVFEQARRQVTELPDEQYRHLCTKLMLEAVETGAEEIVVDKNESRINQDFLDQVNQQLGPDRKGALKLSQERDNLGAGFILKRGKVKTNVSLEVLLDQARKELEIELAKELFAN